MRLAQRAASHAFEPGCALSNHAARVLCLPALSPPLAAGLLEHSLNVAEAPFPRTRTGAHATDWSEQRGHHVASREQRPQGAAAAGSSDRREQRPQGARSRARGSSATWLLPLDHRPHGMVRGREPLCALTFHQVDLIVCDGRASLHPLAPNEEGIQVRRDGPHAVDIFLVSHQQTQWVERVVDIVLPLIPHARPRKVHWSEQRARRACKQQQRQRKGAATATRR